jgi:ubiquinone/menaquinone biosynthesis C-methylase UbiE
MHAAEQKAWKGMGMEGWVARWYTRTRRNDLEDFRREAQWVARQLPTGGSVLEVAPGPGFFSIELAKLGNFSITGLDISNTLVEIAKEHAREAGVEVDFRRGNASRMPLADGSFDFVYCSAAFKNFSDPIGALRPGGNAVIADLRKDASLPEIDAYVNQSGRRGIDAWMTRWTFRHMLLKRAYTQGELMEMAKRSRFKGCRIDADSVSLKILLTKQI